LSLPHQRRAAILVGVIVIRAAAVVLLVTWVFAAQAAETAPPGVLILYSNQRPTPAQVIVEDTLRTVVADGFKRPVELYSEYLDDEWASLETYGAKQAEFLRDKYERRNVRIIVAVSVPALQFLTRFRDRIACSSASFASWLSPSSSSLCFSPWSPWPHAATRSRSWATASTLPKEAAPACWIGFSMGGSRPRFERSWGACSSQ
jgi:hypothetical protein